ncbi:MAG: long-chain fatty acid--CoA ligase [Actinomycetota bacterium]|nr:long-chain fatty acid--CoA ligase [Actinomycetota bacterium]
MLSTMQDFPLTITAIFRHGRSVYGGSEVVTFEGESSRRASFAEVAERTERLAAALRRLGVGDGDRVGTFAWNTQEHLEAYFAVPSMGAVLHTLNIRLFPEQLTYVVNHAEDKVILVDSTLVPLLAKVAKDLKTVEHFVLIGPGRGAPEGTGDGSPLGGSVLSYEELLAAEQGGYAWPEVDERAAAAMCYTSGTTGNPKGVVYSHRSTFLHSLAECSGASFGLSEADRILPIVPMFHANAWGLPYAGWMTGADFIMPGRFLQGEPLCKLIEAERPTISGAVPTVWADILRYADSNAVDFSSIRLVPCGGSAVPRHLMEAFEERHGVRIIQAWGMTETSPLGAVAHPPKGTPPEEEMQWRTKTGRVIAGVELRIVADDGTVLPWDGEAVGEIQVRGPWITASYYKDDDPAKFDDGWLRTGDVGSVDPQGFIQITDRAKDVIKSGGEWISSVELEGELMAHPDVVEAAVVGVPDERWDERPLACVVLREGAASGIDDLKGFLAGRVAKWWLPERWAFIDEVPKTSVGKFDKKVLRSRYAEGELDVTDAG